MAGTEGNNGGVLTFDITLDPASKDSSAIRDLALRVKPQWADDDIIVEVGVVCSTPITFGYHSYRLTMKKKKKKKKKKRNKCVCHFFFFGAGWKEIGRRRAVCRRGFRCSSAAVCHRNSRSSRDSARRCQRVISASRHLGRDGSDPESCSFLFSFFFFVEFFFLAFAAADVTFLFEASIRP